MCLITGVFQVKNSTKQDQAVSRFNIWVMVDYAVVRQTHRHWMVQRVLMSRACACVCVCVLLTCSSEHRWVQRRSPCVRYWDPEEEQVLATPTRIHCCLP